MKVQLANFLRRTVTVKPKHAICLFVLLQIYFSSNMLSFGFWKSGDGVFEYMLVFVGFWVSVLVLLLWLFLKADRHLNSSWIGLAALVVLSIPFAWELWVRSIEIDNTLIRRTVRILLLPAMYLFFVVGLERIRWTACAVLLLCVLSFAGHAPLPVLTGPSRNFDTVEMERKPNVHVIKLDSFTHSLFVEEFMRVENPAADYLATLDDTIYAGSMGFVENVPTKAAFRTLFSLGETSQESGFFSGSTPSRLTVLLQENGYTVSTGYSGDYFGGSKGEYVDHYHRGKLKRLAADLSCTTGYGNLGFCSGFSRSIFSKYFAKGSEDETSKRLRDWPDTAVDLIDVAERNATGPLFSVFYMYRPIGHTQLNYRTGDSEMFSKYKKYFLAQVQRARQVMENIDRLRRRYPDSIFIVSGDHGPWLSRTAPEKDRRFNVLDRHAVALALLNASNLCEWSREWLDGQRYLTPSRMVAASLACDGESRRLVDHFTDNEEFIRFGESFATVRTENR